MLMLAITKSDSITGKNSLFTRPPATRPMEVKNKARATATDNHLCRTAQFTAGV